MVAAVGAGFRDGVKSLGGGQSVMKLCASQWKDAKAAGTTGGLSWPQFLSQCRARQGSAAASPSGGFRSRVRPQPRRPPPVRLSVPMVATVGSRFGAGVECRRAFVLQAGQYTTELAARARCPSDTVVWVNTPTRIYHYSGTRYYGHTLKGGYMCEADARAAGYRAARNRQREAETHSG